MTLTRFAAEHPARAAVRPGRVRLGMPPYTAAMSAAVGLGVLLGLAACSDNSRYSGSASSAPRATAATQPVVAPDMVRQVQSKLRESGYYKQGNIDGVWGGQTQTALRNYQKDHNLTPSGEMDVATLQALNLSPNAGTAPANAAPPDRTTPTTTAPDSTAPVGSPANPGPGYAAPPPSR